LSPMYLISFYYMVLNRTVRRYLSLDA
jgi:hypothetical protein